MGKRGPAKTPTNLTLLHGTFRKDRRPAKEPKPRVTKNTQCPKHLTSEAREIWKRYAPELRRLGLLTKNDVGEFSKYCEYEAEYLRLGKWLRQHGTIYVHKVDQLCRGQSYVYVDEQGRYVTQICSAPMVRQWHKAGELASRIAARFGLSPSDRTGIEINDDGKEIKGDSFMNFVKSRKDRGA